LFNFWRRSANKNSTRGKVDLESSSDKKWYNRWNPFRWLTRRWFGKNKAKEAACQNAGGTTVEEHGFSKTPTFLCKVQPDSKATSPSRVSPAETKSSKNLKPESPVRDSMWRIRIGFDNPWKEVRPYQLEAINKFREPRTVSVGHGDRGVFTATFMPGPLQDNTHYKYKTEDPVQYYNVKYNPKEDDKTTNKIRKWYTHVGEKWLNSEDYEKEAVEKYRKETISVPHPDGGNFEVEFSAQDTPGEDSLYIYTTEDGRDVEMKYSEQDLSTNGKVRVSLKKRLAAQHRFIDEEAGIPSRLSGFDEGERPRDTTHDANFALRMSEGLEPKPGRVEKGTRRNSPKKEKKQLSASSATSSFYVNPDGRPMPPYTTAQELYYLYLPGYQPPKWALERFDPQDPRLNEVKVYSTSTRNDAVVQCITIREPVVIADEREIKKKYYNPYDSGYTRWFKEHKELAPNLAVYARCLMSKWARTPPDKERFVHVFNSIGYAFDNKEQEDYKYYMLPTHTEEKKELLIKDLTNTLRLFIHCAKEKRNGNQRFNDLCFCYLGGGAFKTLYNREKRSYFEVFSKAFTQALQSEEPFVFNSVTFMGQRFLTQHEQTSLLDILRPYNVNHMIKEIGIVGDLADILDVLPKDTLYMNAWDPHSVVGNGNEADGSLDGWFGRLSDLAFLCTPATNPAMLRPEAYVQVSV
jgi:hypothetical protein